MEQINVTVVDRQPGKQQDSELISKIQTENQKICITPAHIEAQIAKESYCRPSGSTLIVCVLTLVNSVEVVGYSRPVVDANFVEELGIEAARKAAIEKLWELEGMRIRLSLLD